MRDLGSEQRAASSEQFKELMAFEVARARGLFAQGRSLPEKVQGRLRWELRFTWQGGVRILDKIEQADYDVFSRRPVVTQSGLVRDRRPVPFLTWTTVTSNTSPARAAAIFTLSFFSLPKEKREAITAVYAFCREVDDAVDDPGQKDPAAEVARWREEIARTYDGHPTTAAHAVAGGGDRTVSI